MEHTNTPWEVVGEQGAREIENADGYLVASVKSFHPQNFGQQEINAAFIVRACNSHDKLMECARAAIAYDKAIHSCADDPNKMSSFCTAQGDDLDTLYFNWLYAARDAIAAAEGERA